MLSVCPILWGWGGMGFQKFWVGMLGRRRRKKIFAFFCFLVSGWQGGWVDGVQQPPSPSSVEERHFWVPGFSKNLGAWVSQITPSPLPVAKISPDVHPNYSGHLQSNVEPLRKQPEVRALI